MKIKRNEEKPWWHQHYLCLLLNVKPALAFFGLFFTAELRVQPVATLNYPKTRLAPVLRTVELKSVTG